MKRIKQLNTENVATGLAVLFLAGIAVLELHLDAKGQPPSMRQRVAIAQSISLLPISSPKTPIRIAKTMNVIVTS